ncbi:MAG TPA: pepsin/retropepsin-like aspartic protease family protein [Thermoanaerobaculia bacterium]|nr:pepsin/retropepsin-like aspartic protease family protein [Thermoanaerobaculia bacterium]
MLRTSALVALLVGAGCALYSEVTVTPLNLLPSNIQRGSDLQSMLEKADYLRAIAMAPAIDARPRKSATDLAALGAAYLAAGRYDEARARLRAALDLEPFRTTYAQIAWDLSQVEYLSNNFESSLEWAKIAGSHQLSIRQWHLEYLGALAKIPVYTFRGTPSARLPFRFGKPQVPRIGLRLNGTYDVEAIIDSGAVLSIVSERLAASLPVRRFGTFEGTFFGLLGEPIPVRFGLVESIEMGSMVIENIPVAIMPDDKMRFLVNKREKQEFRMDFLLGTNLLKEFRLELDFGDEQATFTRLTAADRRPDADQNLFFHGFRPHVRGAVQRRGWYLFVLDTGSEITFLNQSRLANLPVQAFGAGAHSATLQGLGGAMKHGAKLENVEIGVDEWGGIFKTLPMYSGDEREQAVGIIGQNFLRNFNVVIDFGRMRVDLARR